jgi:hypothetical protein
MYSERASKEQKRERVCGRRGWGNDNDGVEQLLKNINLKVMRNRKRRGKNLNIDDDDHILISADVHSHRSLSH